MLASNTIHGRVVSDDLAAGPVSVINLVEEIDRLTYSEIAVKPETIERQ